MPLPPQMQWNVVDALGSSTQTITNKTIDFGSNTVTMTSAELITACSDETGTGVLVFGTSPTIATPTITSPEITLGTGLADGAFTGITEDGTAGATLAFGDLCYLAVADSRWELTDADAEATAFGKLGICVLVATGDGEATTMLLVGNVRADAVFPSLTVGAPVYVDVTAGDISNTAPSGSGDIIRTIGQGNTANELYFKPDNCYFEVT